MTLGQLPFEKFPVEEVRAHRVALVHVLTPEFHGLDPVEFTDIPEVLVDKAGPDELRKFLLVTNTGQDNSSKTNPNMPGKSTVSYQPADRNDAWVRLALTPVEYGLFSRHVSMLGRSAYNGVLAARDKKLRQETGDRAAKARHDDDIAAANRAAVRQVAGKAPAMESYLQDEILPRLEVTKKFLEMTKNRNLSRGTHQTVKDRFEHMRLYVFGDMLDAIGNNKQWSEDQAERAVRIIQKRLYIDGSPAQRVTNFRAMLELAHEYYGHKRAFVLTRVAETKKYLHDNQDAVYDAAAKDIERAREAAK